MCLGMILFLSKKKVSRRYRGPVLSELTFEPVTNMAFELKVIFVLRVEHTKGNEEFVQAHAGFRRYADVVGPQVSLRSEKFPYNQGNQLFNMF